MRRSALILAVIGLSIAGCSDPDAARMAVTAHGMTDFRSTGHSWLGCSKDDSFCTGFEAKNAQGMCVKGAVGSTWLFKGATVRVFDVWNCKQ